MNTDRILLCRDGEPERIEPQAFSMLAFLISRRGRVVSRDELLNEVWGHEYVSESTLSSCIKVVRRAVGDDGTRQQIIRTVHGRGYEFVAEVTETEPVDHGPGPAARTPAHPGAPSSLPAAVHSLIGRGRLINQVKVELHTHRLVTLVGPGGVGKTALAYALARSVEDRYRDGVFAVELITVLDPGATIDAIATALRVHPRQGVTLENAIIELLHARESLLLLDNCEHLVEPLSGMVARIMRSAPRVNIIATSREPLAVAGERLWPVEPLPFADDANPELSVASLTGIPAIELFVERAMAADPNFVLDASTAPAVAEICRRLDGMPLAIELAASRARSIDVSEIAKRLDQRFRLLKGVRRGADPRHQTLHDTVRWSFELLAPAERRIFAELSIFAGPFDLDAAEAICGADDGTDVLDLVTRLAERSMVGTKRSESGLRYELLETLRAFGRGQLESRHSEQLAARHARYYVGLADAVQRGIHGRDEARFLKMAEAALPDLRAAHRFCIDSCDPAGALAMVCALREYAMRTMRYEVLTWADAAMGLAGAERHPLFATATAIRAYVAWIEGKFEAALDLARRAAGLEGELSVTPSGLAERVLANVLYVQGDIDAGLAATTRQLELAEASGDHSRIAHACYMQSIASSSLGDLGAALELAQRARRHALETGSPTDIAAAYTAIGFSTFDDTGAALAAFAEAERIAGEAGNRWMSNFARTEICGLLVERNETDQARIKLAQAVDAWFRAGECSQQWLTLTRCVVALFAIGEYELAARMIGVIEARAVMLGALPATTRLRDQALEVADSLRTTLGAGRYGEMLKSGAEMPVSDVVHAVRRVLLGQAER